MSRIHTTSVAALTLLIVSCSQPTGDNDGNNTIVINTDDDAGDRPHNSLTPRDTGAPPASDMAGDCSTLGCGDDQVCNMQTGQCVDCLTDNECGDAASCSPDKFVCECDTGFHYCDGECVDDSAVDHCGTSCDPCPTDPNGTASCDGAACSLSCDADYTLDGEACVECTSNADCTTPGASMCSGGSCVGCDSNDACSHLGDRSTCSGDGVCVECTRNDDSACGGNSCDVAFGACTNTPKGSQDRCDPCVADTECTPGHACVPMEFQGDARSAGFCLPEKSGDCAAPFAVAVTRTSLSGQTAEYCTVNEDFTTCEAIDDYFQSCADDADCGAVGLNDGRCEPVDFEFARCTYSCDETSDCPTNSLIGCATGDVGDKWCGAF